MSNLLQSHSHKNSMVLVQKQTRVAMELNKRNRHESANLWTIDFLIKKKNQKHIWGWGWGNSIFNEWCWSNWMSVSNVKNTNRSIIITCRKPNSKWIKNLNLKPDVLNLAKEKTGKHPWTHWHRKSKKGREEGRETLLKIWISSKQITQFKIGVQVLTENFQNGKPKWLRSTYKVSVSLIIRDIQSKNTLRFDLTPILMAKVEKPKGSSCW